jgi:hypothetical protein
MGAMKYVNGVIVLLGGLAEVSFVNDTLAR